MVLTSDGFKVLHVSLAFILNALTVANSTINSRAFPTLGRPYANARAALPSLMLGASALARGGESPPRPNPLSAVRLNLVRPTRYFGMCDASGAVAVSSNLFIVASDEDNILRLYRADQPGRPVKQFDCNAFLELQGKSLEADLEGAARIGNRAFWIGSHGRNINGKERFNRHRFFATDIGMSDGEVSPHTSRQALQDAAGGSAPDARFARFHLEEASRRTPKDPKALNIEGLAATPEGHLLIRLPQPHSGRQSPAYSTAEPERSHRRNARPIRLGHSVGPWSLGESATSPGTRGPMSSLQAPTTAADISVSFVGPDLVPSRSYCSSTISTTFIRRPW